MKCQFTLKTVRNSLLLCMVLGAVASNDACAADTIDTTFNKAVTMLKRSPAAVEKVKSFRDRMYNQLRTFLDCSNNEPYAVHVGYMEQNFIQFHEIFVKDANKEFGSIKSLTKNLYAELYTLLAFLKSKIGSKSSTELLSIAQYSHLLPDAFHKECGGTSGLLSRLQHRLSC